MAEKILACQWAVDVSVKEAALRGELETALADPRQPDIPYRDVVRTTVERHLDTARAQVSNGRQGMVARWRGTAVARAYQSLHSAEVSLLELLSPDQLIALVPGVVRRAQVALDRSDPQRAAIEQLPRRKDTTRPAFREAVQQAMRVSFDATDQMYVRVRTFRNMLLSSAVLIMVLMAALVATVAFQPDVLPLCFQPQQDLICPSGAHHPTGGDIPIVAGLGLLGGALAAAFSIRKARGTSTPFNVPSAVALLKPPLGALTAVSGILLLGGDFVPGFSELDNQQQILAYALLFGYAQQLVSRLIDDQAHAVLNKLPSKDAESPQPPATAAVAPIETPPPAPEKPKRRLGRTRSRTAS
jgi:hypothetical protein